MIVKTPPGMPIKRPVHAEAPVVSFQDCWVASRHSVVWEWENTWTSYELLYLEVALHASLEVMNETKYSNRLSGLSDIRDPWFPSEYPTTSTPLLCGSVASFRRTSRLENTTYISPIVGSFILAWKLELEASRHLPWDLHSAGLNVHAIIASDSMDRFTKSKALRSGFSVLA